jgi:hypothetical protein
MKEYKSREFCKDVGCSIQYLIDNKENENLKENPKNYCKRECSAYRFHQWLQDNDYKIVKDMDYTVDILRQWFDILEENLANELEMIDIISMDLDEPLEYIENCIRDLEGRIGEKKNISQGGDIMKLDEFYMVETDHFKQRCEERNVDMHTILYSLRNRLTELRGYRNINKDLIYQSDRFSVIFRIKNKTIILKTVLNKKAEWIKEAIVM